MMAAKSQAADLSTAWRDVPEGRIPGLSGSVGLIWWDANPVVKKVAYLISSGGGVRGILSLYTLYTLRTVYKLMYLDNSEQTCCKNLVRQFL